jgi:hypothetical protein
LLVVVELAVELEELVLVVIDVYNLMHKELFQ